MKFLPGPPSGFLNDLFIVFSDAPVSVALTDPPAKEIYTPAGVMVVVIIDVMIDKIWIRLWSIG